MPLPTIYNTGTASVANGATTLTIVGAVSKAIYAGDFFMDPAQPLVPPQRIASVTGGGVYELAVGWPGTAMTADPYVVHITPDSVRVQERTRQLLEQMSVIEANGRGLFYHFATATTDADPGAGYLRFNNATIGSATAAYLDNVDANGGTVSAILDTWDDNGATGGRGQMWVRSVAAPSTFHAFNVTSSVVDGTGYRKLTLSYIGGSGSLLADDELMVDFVPVGPAGAAGSNGSNGSNGTNGVDGKFSGTEVIKTAAYTALAADVGKTIILNKATAETLSFDAAAALGSTWMVMVKNIGSGTWSLDPNGTETIDGSATISLATGQSCVVACNGTALRSLFRGSTTASDVTNTPAGNIAATTVQAAINELDTEKVGGSTGATDNRLLRSDGTGGATAQASAVTLDDSGNLSGIGTITTTGSISATISTAFGTAAQFVSTDGSATFGPVFKIMRDSASPAADDGLGWLGFHGRDSGGNDTGYGVLSCVLKDPTNGSEDSIFRFNAYTGGTAFTEAEFGNGVVVGAPTGGQKGVGTVNATDVYNDNVALTCMALASEFLASGTVDTTFWDSLVPDRLVPGGIIRREVTEEVVEAYVQMVEGPDGLTALQKTRVVRNPVVGLVPIFDADGNGIDAVERPLTEEVVIPDRIEPRRHELAHRFKAMIDDGFDPRDPVQYIAKLRADEALPGMLTRSEWQHGEHSTGELFGRLWLATEMLALVVINLHERIAVIEGARHG